MKAKELKSGYLACGSSMYHLATTLVRVHWNSISLIESYTMLFDEHHKWNVMIWFWGHYPSFPSNLGMSEGSLVGMGGQKVWWQMGSFVNLDKSGKLRHAMKGRFGPRLMCDGPVMVMGFAGVWCTYLTGGTCGIVVDRPLPPGMVSGTVWVEGTLPPCMTGRTV